MAVKVATKEYAKLIHKLSEGKLLCKRPMIGCLQHTSMGLMLADFFVDTWPNWSTLIGQIKSPKFSTKWDLVCYGKSTGKVWDLIKKETLFIDDKSHLFIGNDKHLYNTPNVPLLSYSSNTYRNLYFPATAKLMASRVPEGYFLQKLESQHADRVIQYWPYFQQMTNKREMITTLIKNFTSIGIFMKENPSQPVSWSCLLHCGEIAFGYTMPEHRRKGLSKVAITALTREVLKSNMTPYMAVKIENEVVQNFSKKIGFVEDNLDNDVF